MIGRATRALLAAYAAGNAHAFAELYERHERPVYRYFLRQGAAPAIADDLLQETWMAVIRNAARFEPRARFTTWLYTVARSKMVDHWRAQDGTLSFDEAANDPGDAPLEVAGSDADRPDVQALSRAEARAFVAAVEALPPAQREAFLLQAEGGSIAAGDRTGDRRGPGNCEEPTALCDDQTAVRDGGMAMRPDERVRAACHMRVHAKGDGWLGRVARGAGETC